MSPKQLTEDELLRPTKYKVDHGTMTMMPEKTIPTMTITVKGSPPVFLREGVFYDQGGNEYDMDQFPGGEKGLIRHLVETANPEVLAMHGLAVDGAATAPKADVAPVRRLPPKETFRPSDTGAEKAALLGTLGEEREMDIESISSVLGLHPERVRKLLSDLGDQIERTGEGKRGSPYLYRLARKTE